MDMNAECTWKHAAVLYFIYSCNSILGCNTILLNKDKLKETLNNCVNTKTKEIKDSIISLIKKITNREWITQPPADFIVSLKDYFAEKRIPIRFKFHSFDQLTLLDKINVLWLMCEHRVRTDEKIQECLKNFYPVSYVNEKDKYAYYYWGTQKNQENSLIYIDKSIKNVDPSIKAYITAKKSNTLKFKITALKKYKRMQYDYPSVYYDTECFICNQPVQNHPNWCLFCYKQCCSKCASSKSQYVCPYCAQDFKMMNKCVVCNKEKKEGKEFHRCSNCFAPFHSKCRGILTYTNTEHWLCCQCEEHSLLSYMGFLLPPINIEKYTDSIEKFLAIIKQQDIMMYFYFEANMKKPTKSSSSSHTKLPIITNPIEYDDDDDNEVPPVWSPDMVNRQSLIFDSVLKSVINTIKMYKKSAIFLQPVNPINDNVPDYFEIIKKPMDIRTIENNVKNKIYFQYADFHDDVMRVWNNCIKYHSYKGLEIYRKVGETMKDFYINNIYNKLCELKWNYLERDDETGDSEDENNYGGGGSESQFKLNYPKHGILKRYCKCLNYNRTGMVVCHSNLTRDHCHGYIHLSCFDLTESDYNDSFICPLCRDKTVIKKEIIIKPDRISDRTSLSSSVSAPVTPIQPSLLTTTPLSTPDVNIENKELAVKRNLPYTVDRIIGKRFLSNDGIVQYRVFWKNCDLNGASWEPKEDVEINCQSLIEQYEKGFVMKEEHFEENRYVIAMYDFKTEKEDELPFRKGDRIKVLSPPESTLDWKEGELKGRVGSYPCNYVKECPVVKEKWVDELEEENILMAGYLQDRSKVSLEYYIEKNK